MMRVGLVGLGRMGSAIVPHLVRGCSSVTVWNRSPAKANEAAGMGARAARSLVELVEASDIVLSLLLDDAAVQDVYLGPAGLLAAACAGRLFLEMSTIAPGTVRGLAAAASERGAVVIDTPVSGSVGPAREGKLLVLAGGAAEDLERARPVLSLFARRIAHLGAVGAGMSMKIALQLPIYVYWQALAEAVCIGTCAGLDTRDMLDLISDSPAALAALKPKIPVILEEDDNVTFALSAAHKDLAVIRATAAEFGVASPAALAALESFGSAMRAGWGDKDVAQLVCWTSRRAKLSGKPPSQKGGGA